MTKLLTHPENPVCKTGTTPREFGETRTRSNGQIWYNNPMTGHWEAAIRLNDIRAKILREEDPSQYTFPKKHGNKGGKHPTNYTSFLPKDKDFGPLRANRPDILFRITRDGQYSVQPAGYLLDEGRIVLDAFDHGIRDFPHLPKVLSSELEGHDIEYYCRQNAQLTDYDLIARMPNYWGGKGNSEWKTPRGGTINQRAQRYRGTAGLISWNQREGTQSKNDYILSLIPGWCKNPAVNSIKHFRDLEKAERVAVTKQNEGKMLSRARNAKREDKQDGDSTNKKKGKQIYRNTDDVIEIEREDSAEERPAEDAVEEYHEGKNVSKNDRLEDIDDEGASKTNYNEEGPAFYANDKKDHYRPNLEDEYEAQAEDEAALDATGSEDSIHASLHWIANPNNPITSSKGDFDCPITRKTAAEKIVAGPRHAVNTAPRRSHGGNLPPGQPLNTYRKHYLAQDDDDYADDSYVPKLKRARVGNTSHLSHGAANTSTQPRKLYRKNPSYFRSPVSLKCLKGTSSMNFHGNLNSELCTTSATGSFSQAAGHVDSNFPTSLTKSLTEQEDPPLTNRKRKRDVNDKIPDIDQDGVSKRSKVNKAVPSSEAIAHPAQSVHVRRDKNRAKQPRKAYNMFGAVSQRALDLEPQHDEDFQTEAEDGIERGDYRYITPKTDAEQEEISKALELTRVNFFSLKGSMPPQDLNKYAHESYASQFRRLHQHHTKKWMGELPVPLLYSLSAWYHGFDKWRTDDSQGRELSKKVRDARVSHARLMKEIHTEESKSKPKSP
ncbi:hypothetical protein N7G274_008393 [Stereocaulon virgatum]|uniref:Uncharacterized protein n=1 Tax=Stereocaulon virgatum TaxID=373712 RepID=A0ABR4A1P2_9LECA